jgi:hypothetical protein
MNSAKQGAQAPNAIARFTAWMGFASKVKMHLFGSGDFH